MEPSFLKFPLILGVQCLFLGAATAATVIDFESDTLGAQPAGWNFSTDGANVDVVTTTTSGHYIGGKAIRTIATTNTSEAGLLVGNMSGITGMRADFRWDVSTGTLPVLGVFGWVDAGDNGIHANGENQAGFGLRNQNSGQFALNPNADGFASGIQYSADTWYRLTMTWGAEISGNRTVSLNVVNLTNNSSLVGNFNTSMTSAQFGADPSTWDGVAIRMTRGTIDNITIIPEPSTALLGAFGLLALMRRRRA